jgi:hypothetical protein
VSIVRDELTLHLILKRGVEISLCHLITAAAEISRKLFDPVSSGPECVP